MWNVRIVSCVPGSPIDWAAITPTASPRFTIVAAAPGRGRSTRTQTPRGTSQVSTERIRTFSTPAVLDAS